MVLRHYLWKYIQHSPLAIDFHVFKSTKVMKYFWSSFLATPIHTIVS